MTSARPDSSLETPALDALYGLEPVFEPGHDPRQRPLDSGIVIECPNCWQTYESSVDLSLGSQSYIEDCQICCGSISVEVIVADDGFEAQVSTRKLDE